MKKIWNVIVFSFIGFFLLAGCSMETETDNTIEEDGITVVDVLDRKVEIKGPVEQVYYGFYYENLLAVGGADVFKKVKATSLYDTEGYFLSLSELYREYVAGYDDMLDVGSTLQDNFDVEKLLEMDLDVVILGAYQYDMLGDTVSVIENAGIPVVAIDYTTGSLELQIESTSILGELFGTEDRAQGLIDQYQSNYQDIESRLANVTNSPKIFAEFQTTISSYKDIGTSAVEGNFFGDYLKLSAGNNIMNGFGTDSENTSIEPEYLLEANPDYLVFVGGESSNGEKDGVVVGHDVTEKELTDSTATILSNRPGWSELSAVENNDIYVIDDAVARTLADYTIVQYLAKVMHPEQMKDIDPLESLEQYYHEYLPGLPFEGTFFYKLHAEDIQ
ncbi:ABC transporter substrate-binding protein [Paraliobacillus sediminis]|uniref:ABC transporter substrate-binding protein n=1 Tax=Paraliobacillus sediminis TaxID=1885916 RepID=UPI000E3E08C1|nr:ABC transporter substrate-binding protein [Paraliobacillus sediminis]